MDKKEALAAAVKQIEKQFGKGAIMKMGEAARMDITAVPEELLKFTDLKRAAKLP